MEKTTKIINEAIEKFNANATKDEKRLFAMYLTYNIAMGACENHLEASGLLGGVINEIHSEFSNGSLVKERFTLN